MVDHSARQLLLTSAPHRVGAMYGCLCMKFFCRSKDKVIQVKIVNDPLTTSSPVPLSSAPEVKAEETRINYELALKLAAAIAVIVNSLLAMMGYVDFTGKLETLGISTNEIDLGLPTLLFQGYVAVVLAAYIKASAWFPWGALVLTLIATLIFYYPVSKLLATQSWLEKGIFSLLLTLALDGISIIPTLGLQSGLDSAYSTFEKQNPVGQNQSIQGLETTMTINTKEGVVVTGETVFASALYTYVLQGAKLYKIANRDNHIVSMTKINPVLRSKQKEEPPKANAGS